MDQFVTYDQFRRHNHDGIETDEIDIDFSSVVQSFYSPHAENSSVQQFSTDDDEYIPLIKSDGTLTSVNLVGGPSRYQSRNLTSDWAAADDCWGAIVQGPYLYILVRDSGATPDEWRIYRFDKDDLDEGGTEMSFSGTLPDLTTNSNLRMASDGTHVYLNYDGGNSANAYVLAKYSVSGTSFVYQSSITCGSATLGFNSTFIVLANGSIYTLDSTNRNISKFDKTGTLVYTDSTNSQHDSAEMLSNVENVLFVYNVLTHFYLKPAYT